MHTYFGFKTQVSAPRERCRLPFPRRYVLPPPTAGHRGGRPGRRCGAFTGHPPPRHWKVLFLRKTERGASYKAKQFSTSAQRNGEVRARPRRRSRRCWSRCRRGRSISLRRLHGGGQLRFGYSAGQRRLSVRTVSCDCGDATNQRRLLECGPLRGCGVWWVDMSCDTGYRVVHACKGQRGKRPGASVAWSHWGDAVLL